MVKFKAIGVSEGLAPVSYTHLDVYKRQLLTQPGDTPVYLYPMDTRKKTLAKRTYWCRPDVAFLEKLRFLLGEENVILQ